MQNEPFSFKKRLHSFRYAFRGIYRLVKEEHNARIHFIAMLCVIAVGIFFGLSPMEWIAICFSIGGVFGAEAFNSAIESLADYVSPDYHKMIERAKDLSAGGVLFVAITAFIVGLVVFVPKIMALF